MSAENEVNVKVKAENDTGKGLGEAKEKIEEFSHSITNVTGEFAELAEKIPLVGELIAAAFSVREIIEFMEHFADLSEKLDFASQALGMTASKVSELQLAMGLFQMDADSATAALTRLERGMADAAATGTGPVARAFQALGIEIQDSSGHLKSLDVVLPEIMERFHNTADGVEKTSIALSLFGRGSSNMVAFLNAGSEGLAHMQEEIRKTGAVMTEDFQKGALELADKFDMFKVALQGVAVTLHKELQPAFIDLMGAVNEGVVAFVKFENENQVVAKTVAVVVSTIRILALAFDGIGIGVDSAIRAAVALRDAYLSNMASIKEAVIDVWQSTWVQQAVSWVEEGANRMANGAALLWEKFTNSLRDIKKEIMESLGAIWDKVLEKVHAALGKLGEWLSYVPGMEDFASKLKNALGGGAKAAAEDLEGGTNHVKATLDGIGTKISEFGENARKGLNLDKANADMTSGAARGQEIMRDYLAENAGQVNNFAAEVGKTFEKIHEDMGRAFGEKAPELPAHEGKNEPKERLTIPKEPGAGANKYIQELSEQLRRAEVDEKISYDKRTQFEIDFWQNKLKTVKTGSDEYYAISEKLYPLLWQQQQEAATKGAEAQKKAIADRLAEETGAIHEEMRLSEARVEGEKARLDAMVALGRMSNEEKFTALREMTMKEFAIQIQAFQKEADLDNQTVKRKAEIYARIAQMRVQQANAIEQIAAQEAQYELQQQTQQVHDQQALDNLVLEGERNRLQGQIQIGEVYGEHKFQMLQQQLQQEFAAKRAALESEYQLDNQTVERKQQIMQQLLQLDQQYYNQKMALDYQAQQETINAWQGVATAIGNPLNQMVNGVLTGTQTMEEGFRRFCGNMVLAFADMVAQMLVRWAVWLVATQVAGASIPFGNFVFGAGMLALFDEGTNYVPKDMVAGIHEGEMIIPAAQAKKIRDGMGVGGSFDANKLPTGETAAPQETHLNVNLTVETMDAHSFKSNINRYAGILASAVSQQLRLNPSLRPQF